MGVVPCQIAVGSNQSRLCRGMTGLHCLAALKRSFVMAKHWGMRGSHFPVFMCCAMERVIVIILAMPWPTIEVSCSSLCRPLTPDSPLYPADTHRPGMSGTGPTSGTQSMEWAMIPDQSWLLPSPLTSLPQPSKLSLQ